MGRRDQGDAQLRCTAPEHPGERRDSKRQQAAEPKETHALTALTHLGSLPRSSHLISSHRIASHLLPSRRSSCLLPYRFVSSRRSPRLRPSPFPSPLPHLKDSTDIVSSNHTCTSCYLPDVLSYLIPVQGGQSGNLTHTILFQPTRDGRKVPLQPLRPAPLAFVVRLIHSGTQVHTGRILTSTAKPCCSLFHRPGTGRSAR